jgi:peptidoglycan/LPS O-acetylase OafA/YrhL
VAEVLSDRSDVDPAPRRWWRDRTGAPLRRITRIVEVVGLVVGGALVIALIQQYLDVYLTFFGQPPTATQADGDRYVGTAVTCLALVTLALVAALVGRHRRVARSAVALLVVAVLVAAICTVPKDRWGSRAQALGDGGGCSRQGTSLADRRL